MTDDLDFGNFDFDDSTNQDDFDSMFDVGGNGDTVGNGSADFNGTNSNNVMNSNDAAFNNNPNTSGDFDNLFDADSNTGTYDNSMSEDQRSSLMKKYAIIIAIGLIFTVIVLVIGTRVAGKKRNTADELLNSSNTVQGQTQNIENKNVDNIMGDNKQSQTVQPQANNTQSVDVNYHKDENDFFWMEIKDNENVEFQEEYSEKVFTITTVKHYARAVDSANNLVIKSTLTGSISGLSGTYTLEIPYSKGVMLKTGNSFTVNVLLGTYGDKIVVGDITY